MSAGRFGISEATRSPGFSPKPSKPTARRSLRSSSVRHVQRVSAEISASPSRLASKPARSKPLGLTGLPNALPAYQVTPPPPREQDLVLDGALSRSVLAMRTPSLKYLDHMAC